MLFLAIIGVVIFLLAIFSVMSAHQNGGGWKFLAFIAVLSGLVTIYAVVKLPYWPYNQTATATAKKNAAATSSADAKKASVQSSVPRQPFLMRTVKNGRPQPRN